MIHNSGYSQGQTRWFTSCRELHLPNEPWPRDPEVSSCVPSLDYLALSPFVSPPRLILNSAFETWNGSRSIACRSPAGQMRRVQLLLHRLEPHTAGRGASLNKFSSSLNLSLSLSLPRPSVPDFLTSSTTTTTTGPTSKHNETAASISSPSAPVSVSHISGLLIHFRFCSRGRKMASIHSLGRL